MLDRHDGHILDHWMGYVMYMCNFLDSFSEGCAAFRAAKSTSVKRSEKTSRIIDFLVGGFNIFKSSRAL
jgi:hypothetical protein